MVDEWNVNRINSSSAESQAVQDQLSFVDETVLFSVDAGTRKVGRRMVISVPGMFTAETMLERLPFTMWWPRLRRDWEDLGGEGRDSNPRVVIRPQPASRLLP